MRAGDWTCIGGDRKEERHARTSLPVADVAAELRKKGPSPRCSTCGTAMSLRDPGLGAQLFRLR